MDLAREYIILPSTHLITLVSILVLMDLAREFNIPSIEISGAESFNPCFNGSCSRIQMKSDITGSVTGFNPCFNGSCSRIRGP